MGTKLILSHLVPCRLSVEAVGLSVHLKDTPVPIK